MALPSLAVDSSVGVGSCIRLKAVAREFRMRRPPCESKPYRLTLSSANRPYRLALQEPGDRLQAPGAQDRNRKLRREPTARLHGHVHHADAPRWWRSAVAASKWSAMTTTLAKGSSLWARLTALRSSERLESPTLVRVMGGVCGVIDMARWRRDFIRC